MARGANFALALAAVQGMGIAKAMEGLDDVAQSPGPIFRLGVVVSILGATAFLIWLARIMTERGTRGRHAGAARRSVRRASAQ